MSSIIYEFDHSVGADLDYGFDWLTKGWLASGETIITSSWAIAPSISLHSAQNNGTVTSVFVSGGVSGTYYVLTNTVITSSSTPRTDTRSIKLSCKAR